MPERHHYQFEAFPDSSFGELTESIQKWTAQIDQKGDALVAAIGTGNPNPIVQALKERGIAPGTIAVGSTDIPPPISSRSPRAGCSGASTSSST